jgi:hypothetical protein
MRQDGDGGYGRDADPSARQLTGPRSQLFTNGKIYATMMIDIREYHDRAGRSPFREWFDELNSEAPRRKKDQKEGE